MKAKLIDELTIKSGDGKIDFKGVKGDIYEVTIGDDSRYSFDFVGLDGEPVPVTLPKKIAEPLFEEIKDTEEEA